MNIDAKYCRELVKNWNDNSFIREFTEVMLLIREAAESGSEHIQLKSLSPQTHKELEIRGFEIKECQSCAAFPSQIIYYIISWKEE